MPKSRLNLKKFNTLTRAVHVFWTPEYTRTECDFYRGDPNPVICIYVTQDLCQAKSLLRGADVWTEVALEVLHELGHLLTVPQDCLIKPNLGLPQGPDDEEDLEGEVKARIVENHLRAYCGLSKRPPEEGLSFEGGELAKELARRWSPKEALGRASPLLGVDPLTT